MELINPNIDPRKICILIDIIKFYIEDIVKFSIKEMTKI